MKTQKERADVVALLDSGATENFINPRALRKYGIKPDFLQNPRNVDRTMNKAGEITQAVDLRIRMVDKTTNHWFFVAEIGEDGFILGYPFLGVLDRGTDDRVPHSIV